MKNHKITVVKYHWEFEGSHGRTSPHTGIKASCSCGSEIIDHQYGDDKSLRKAIIDHKIQVLLDEAGITFEQVNGPDEYE